MLGMKLSELLWRSDLKEKFVLQKFLCVFLSCSREELWMNMDKNISDEIIQKVLIAYKSYIEDKKPLEYILGHVDFFGREFFVNEATLIPRPETEYMITAVTEYINWELRIQNWEWKKNMLLDIGTGCGVLGISVLLQNPDYFAHVVFSDYFANALEIAKKNYQNLITDLPAGRQGFSWKVEFFQSDLLDFIKSSTLKPSDYAEDKDTPSFAIKEDSNIVLVANLPYIPEEMFEANVSDNVKKWEPKPAFVGGVDGLDYYRKMFDQVFILGIRTITMFLEMMTWQVDILRQEFGDRLAFEEVKTFHFNIRIVKVLLK